MYTLSRPPSKIAASSRKGPPRRLDFKSYEGRDKHSKNSPISDNSLEMSNPKPTFPQRRSLNKKMTPPPASNNHLDLRENHDEMTKLLSCQWKKVEDGLKKSRNQEDPAWKIYREKEPDKSLEDFQPFELEPLEFRVFKNTRGKPS